MGTHSSHNATWHSVQKQNASRSTWSSWSSHHRMPPTGVATISVMASCTVGFDTALWIVRSQTEYLAVPSMAAVVPPGEHTVGQGERTIVTFYRVLACLHGANTAEPVRFKCVLSRVRVRLPANSNGMCEPHNLQFEMVSAAQEDIISTARACPPRVQAKGNAQSRGGQWHGCALAGWPCRTAFLPHPRCKTCEA